MEVGRAKTKKKREGGDVRTGWPAEEHVAAKADWAALATLLAQALAMAPCTLRASEPQMVFRSAGLGSVLMAARRQAGGVARTEVVRAWRERATTVGFMFIDSGKGGRRGLHPS